MDEETFVPLKTSQQPINRHCDCKNESLSLQESMKTTNRWSCLSSRIPRTTCPSITSTSYSLDLSGQASSSTLFEKEPNHKPGHDFLLSLMSRKTRKRRLRNQEDDCPSSLESSSTRHENAPHDSGLEILINDHQDNKINVKERRRIIKKTTSSFMLNRSCYHHVLLTTMLLMIMMNVIPDVICQASPYHDYIHFQHHDDHLGHPPTFSSSLSSSPSSSSIRHASPYFDSDSRFRSSPSYPSYSSQYPYQGDYSSESMTGLPPSPSSSSNTPNIVRHPGTCTFQRSQPACTFSLLCYLAGGLPVEACEGNVGLTCCVLSSSSGHSVLDAASGPVIPPSSLPTDITPNAPSSYSNSYPVGSSSSSMVPPSSSSSSSSSSSGSSLYNSDPYPYDREVGVSYPKQSQRQNPAHSVSYHNSRLPSSRESSSSLDRDYGRAYNQIPNVSYQRQAQHHAVQHVPPPSPVTASDNSRPHQSSVSSHSLSIPSTAPMIHSYPHVLPVPASSVSSSAKVASSSETPPSATLSSPTSLASPTSVQTPSSSINSIFDDTNVRRSIPSSSALSSSEGGNSLNEFIVRNQHARNFAGEDGE